MSRGTPRSGTTLTACIMGRHPDLFMGGENQFFEDILPRRSKLGEPARDPEARERILECLLSIYGRYNQNSDQARVDILFANGNDALEQLAAARSYQEFLGPFMVCQAKAEGCARWGNNTPKDIFHFREILGFYPNSVFIVCTHDIRDFLVSDGPLPHRST